MTDISQDRHPKPLKEFQGIIRMPKKIDREARYALQAVFTDEGALRVTDELFASLKKLCGCNDNLILKRDPPGTLIDGYLCEGDELELGGWAFAELLHKVFGLEIDMAWSDQVVPLPATTVSSIRIH